MSNAPKAGSEAAPRERQKVLRIYPDAKIGRFHHSYFLLGAGGRISEYVGSEDLAWASAASKIAEPTASPETVGAPQEREEEFTTVEQLEMCRTQKITWDTEYMCDVCAVPVETVDEALALLTAVPEPSPRVAGALVHNDLCGVDSCHFQTSHQGEHSWEVAGETAHGKQELQSAIIQRANYLLGRCIPLLHILSENEQAAEVLRLIKEYAALPAPQPAVEGQWIDVNTDMPPEDEYVIVQSGDHVCEGWWSSAYKSKWRITRSPGSPPRSPVTRWMPMPTASRGSKASQPATKRSEEE